MAALKVAREQLLERPSWRAVFVQRPRSRCFHVYAGPLTPSRRAVPSSRRPVCGIRTRRLQVSWGPIASGDATLCRRCDHTLAPHEYPPTMRAAGAGDHAQPLPLVDLMLAATAILSHDEAHAVERVALVSGYPAYEWVRPYAVAAKSYFPDPACCRPAHPADLSLDYTARSAAAYGARNQDRRNRRRLGAGAPW